MRSEADRETKNGGRSSATHARARCAGRSGTLAIDVASAGMVTRTISVAAPDVCYVKGIVDACDGLGAVLAERGGELTLMTPPGRERELDELVCDLRAELARGGA